MSFKYFFKQALDRNKSSKNARDFAIVQCITQACKYNNVRLNADAEANLVIHTEDVYERHRNRRTAQEQVFKNIQAFLDANIQEAKGKAQCQRSAGHGAFDDYTDIKEALPNHGRGSRYEEDIRHSKAYRPPTHVRLTPSERRDEPSALREEGEYYFPSKGYPGEN
jgi:hypothetical protein